MGFCVVVRERRRVFEVVELFCTSAAVLMVIFLALKCYFKSRLCTDNWGDISLSAAYEYE